MKKNAASEGAAPAPKTRTAARRGRIHPVIIFPFQSPNHYNDLEELYGLVARLDAERGRFARPLTVLDCKTSIRLQANRQFQEFRRDVVAKHSDILERWYVDTCQMWYTGLGTAWEQGATDDTYWLIPGDFNYGSPIGKEVLSRLHDLPEIIDELDQDLCIGEITRDSCDSKCLIDTYGTFAMLLNWFPEEAQELHSVCERPRSEFLAMRHGFLSELLSQRWYAYEQTLVILLHAIWTKRKLSRFAVGDISDLPHGQDTLASAVQQIERMERVLKMVWRERNEKQPGWFTIYRALESQSELIRNTATGLLSRLLK